MNAGTVSPMAAVTSPQAAPKTIAPAQPHVVSSVLGLGFGLTLSLLQFSDFGQVHQMFSLTDLRLLFAFCGSVGLIVIGRLLLARRVALRKSTFHPGLIPGAVLFGLGWALAGACPAVALVQLGEGYLPALVLLAGMVAGNQLYAVLHRRFFRWSMESCDG
jgi:uncharacterized protein